MCWLTSKRWAARARRPSRISIADRRNRRGTGRGDGLGYACALLPRNPRHADSAYGPGFGAGQALPCWNRGGLGARARPIPGKPSRIVGLAPSVEDGGVRCALRRNKAQAHSRPAHAPPTTAKNPVHPRRRLPKSRAIRRNARRTPPSSADKHKSRPNDSMTQIVRKERISRLSARIGDSATQRRRDWPVSPSPPATRTRLS
jgi:hypothetical protein